MKKLFNSPAIEVKSLSPETEVMGVFSVASSLGLSSDKINLLKDTKSVVDDYKSWKQNQ